MKEKGSATMSLQCFGISSPFGTVAVLLNSRGLIARVLLPGEGENVIQDFPGVVHLRGREFPEIRDAFERFFRGEPVRFPLDWADLGGCRPFQRKVLIHEHAIPRGRVRSYGGLARIVGAAGAARAVGRALSKNPVPLVVPCHRTVRGDGSLGGFGGGLPMKRALLEMEGIVFDPKGRILPEFILP